ncbi:MAG: UDP-N-acetylglucosamine 1-carboxyvinyltransferase [Oscillospiraceae bacterium]|nr:UDP-N-acetylglucosamine 1-carboxyvinyltransferase [Oscillospiraceae bacterium]
MSAFIVEGGKRLEGQVQIYGAKNSVLPILAATILVPGTSVIHNCPDLSDVTASIEILRHLGCMVQQDGDTITVDATHMLRCDIPDRLMRQMRSSVIFLGAVLGRMGCAEMSFPGGCELGPRPVDLHLAALRTMGARIDEDGGGLRCEGELTGCDITLAMPSVGATENIMLAAVAAEGTTTITNAAREPEILDLQQFLLAFGANVSGAGSSVITIEGGQPLSSGEHRIIGDRIVAATYLAATAAAGGKVEITGADYRHLSTVSSCLAEGGCILRSSDAGIQIESNRPLAAVRPIRTAPYPGFPTDAQAPLMAAFARGTGTTVFVENIFESRYRHVDELTRMGADIKVEGRVAIVCGVPQLHGAAVQATDLRGGAALLVAALGAKGSSEITGLHHIDRGYQNLDGALRGLGASIWRR